MAGGCDHFLRKFEFPQVPHLVPWHSSLLEHQPDEEGLEGDINVFIHFFKIELKVTLEPPSEEDTVVESCSDSESEPEESGRGLLRQKDFEKEKKSLAINLPQEQTTERVHNKLDRLWASPNKNDPDEQTDAARKPWVRCKRATEKSIEGCDNEPHEEMTMVLEELENIKRRISQIEHDIMNKCS